jgi:hypothetical protein
MAYQINRIMHFKLIAVIIIAIAMVFKYCSLCSKCKANGVFSKVIVSS